MDRAALPGLRTSAEDEQLDTLIRLTERYGVVLRTITTAPAVSVTRMRA